MDSVTDELGLIRAAAAGDRAALTLLLTNSYAGLRTSVARKIPPDLRSTIDADDIVQETHIEVFRRVGGFEAHDETSFGRWVRTIAKNRLRNAIKHRRAAKRGGGRVQIKRARSIGESVTTLLNVMAVTDRTPSQSAARIESGSAPSPFRRAKPDARDYLLANGADPVGGI